MRAFRKLPEVDRVRLKKALKELAAQVGIPGRVAGKKSKTLQGARDKFHRLRVGDHRVMYDIIEEDRVLLILGIVHRKDLDRWLRTR